MTNLIDLKKIAESTVNRICKTMNYPETAVYVSQDKMANTTRATLLDFANNKDMSVEQPSHIDAGEWAKGISIALRRLHTDPEAEGREGCINFTMDGVRYAVAISNKWFSVYRFDKSGSEGEYNIALEAITCLLKGTTKITDSFNNDLKASK